VPGVAEGGTPDDEAVRVQALKNAKGVNFLRPGFGGFASRTREYPPTKETLALAGVSYALYFVFAELVKCCE
jgi:hypothetical protein